MIFDPPPIDRLRAQDHQAFATLVDAHYTPVFRYLARLIADREVAAELTQDTFLRAYQALPRLDDDSDLTGWIFRIATNLARQHHRRHRLIRWLPLEASATPVSHLEEDVARQDLVRRALCHLSLEQRACLLLYAWTGCTCAEIARILGKSTDAVRMLLVRARRSFRMAYAAASAASTDPYLDRYESDETDFDAPGAAPPTAGPSSKSPRHSGTPVAGGAAAPSGAESPDNPLDDCRTTPPRRRGNRGNGTPPRCARRLTGVRSHPCSLPPATATPYCERGSFAITPVPSWRLLPIAKKETHFYETNSLPALIPVMSKR
jgi:RNA polymerase sigma-70 factor, ECF subfamily